MNYNYQPQGTQVGPHIRETWTSKWKMQQVLIALLFPTFAACFYFGWYSLVMISVSIVTCVILEFLTQKVLKKESTIGDCSAIVTGWLLALTLPITAPIWALIIGDIIAIVIVKQLSGGIGRNWLNPAVAARVLLKLFFSPWITNWVTPQPEVVTTATPLQHLGHFTRHVTDAVPPLWKLFVGWELGGPIGETSKLALLLACIYLVARKIIHIQVPLLTLGSFYIVMLLYSGFDFQFATAHLFSGALVFGAVFMVTDYTTTPLTDKGKYIFACCCGVLCAVLRIVLDLPGGIGLAILVMNLCTPFIDKWCLNRIYGEGQTQSIKE